MLPSDYPYNSHEPFILTSLVLLLQSFYLFYSKEDFYTLGSELMGKEYLIISSSFTFYRQSFIFLRSLEQVYNNHISQNNDLEQEKDYLASDNIS